MQKVGNTLFRYRYIIALILFFICIILELHGSSFNLWLEWLPGNQQNEELLFGKLREIRSDEWAVFTPLTLAQKDNPLGAFSYFSTLTRGGITDSFIVYGQPVWSPLMVFRIFQVGFLLLDMGKGMACFWIGRGIALFLVTIEMGMLLTKKNKLLSTALGFMVVFAPMVQWWYAINGFVEMLITGQLAVLVVDKYMRTKRYLIRFGLILALVWCGGTYVLTFYPAWMVPLAYIWLVLLIGVILKNKDNFQWRWKYDTPLILFFFLLLGGSLFYAFYKSWDCIQAVLNTVYPGKRVSVGGDVSWVSMLTGLDLFLPYRDITTASASELAVFMDFFPIGTIFAFFVMIKRKKADIYLTLLLIIDLLFTGYTVIGFPEWLAKITLLSFSTSSRVATTITLVRLFELFRAVGLYAKECPPLRVRRRWGSDYVRAFVGVMVVVLIAAQMGVVNYKIAPDYLSKMDAIIIAVLFFVIGWFVWNSNQNHMARMFSIICIIISFVAGATVNPIQKGLSQVKENPLLVQMKAIDQEDPGIWITEDMGFPCGNLPLLAGVPSLTATNVYPNLDEWAILDPQGLQENIYNRYAHISITLVNEPTSFLLNGMDWFTINLNPDDLDKLNVKYLISQRDLTQFNRTSYYFEEKLQMEQYRIYKIIKN